MLTFIIFIAFKHKLLKSQRFSYDKISSARDCICVREGEGGGVEGKVFVTQQLEGAKCYRYAPLTGEQGSKYRHKVRYVTAE